MISDFGKLTSFERGAPEAVLKMNALEVGER
jgi:hypothetical protein